MSDSTNDEPLTLAQVKAKRPEFKDVPIDGLGTLRLHRPADISVILEFADRVGELADDDGNMELADMIQSLTTFVCQMLGGDFDSDDGIATIKALGVGITPLIKAASELAGMNLGENADEAKND